MGLSAKALADTILTEIGNLTLDIDNCRGQGYDAAASVSGHINGLSAHILRINEKVCIHSLFQSAVKPSGGCIMQYPVC